MQKTYICVLWSSSISLTSSFDESNKYPCGLKITSGGSVPAK